MSKGPNQKQKLLRLADIFKRETDIDHGLTLEQIAGKLESYGILAERKTLYDDFEVLRNYGLDIISEKQGKKFIYKLCSNDFELWELKLLVDSVQASRFITEKNSKELIEKLTKLGSIYNEKDLDREVIVSGRIKRKSEYNYSVDDIHEAINKNCQIKFKYYHWNTKGQLEPKKDGAWYQVSPWHLWLDNENYYLIAYDNVSQKLKHYRVDKIKNVCVLEDVPRMGLEGLKNSDASEYVLKHTNMFGGEDTFVTIQAPNSKVGIFMDRFGKDIPVTAVDEGHFETHVKVAESDQFLGWIIGLGADIRITSPERTIKKMQALIERLRKQYQ